MQEIHRFAVQPSRLQLPRELHRLPTSKPTTGCRDTRPVPGNGRTSCRMWWLAFLLPEKHPSHDSKWSWSQSTHGLYSKGSRDEWLAASSVARLRLAQGTTLVFRANACHAVTVSRYFSIAQERLRKQLLDLLQEATCCKIRITQAGQCHGAPSPRPHTHTHTHTHSTTERRDG
jgi:hypothetical protein